MKFKSIIASGLLLLGVGAATTSCEDMFTPENNLVTTELAPKDTVYQVMGIIKRMQTLADRTVLLGELRADLVDVDPAHSTIDLQELGNNSVSEGNIYNRPADYYAVINNCNIYLAHVDSMLVTHGKKYYRNEICGVKTFRAWCYLELAKIYGEVPLITEPVLTADAAEKIVASGNKASLKEIADFCINDLKGYAYESENLDLRPGYANDAKYAKYFIPVRVMLGELYLWRGSVSGAQADYLEAARMYHDFLTFPSEENPTGEQRVEWMSSSFVGTTDMYSSLAFDYTLNQRPDWAMCAVATLPLDTLEYYGTFSELRSVFCSSYKNNYYSAVNTSDRMKSIAQGQVYCFYNYVSPTQNDTLYGSRIPSSYSKPDLMGDLRLPNLFNAESVNNKYNSSLNDERSYNMKYTGGSMRLANDERLSEIPYYRYTTIYLHLAEALNRAGFPETAFAVLKYGLTEQVLSNRDIVSLDEFLRLGQIKSYGFTKTSLNLPDSLNNSFLVWDVATFHNIDKNVPRSMNSSITIGSGSATIGIHSMGSGDSEFNAYYVLPAVKDRVVEIVRPVAPTYNKKEDPDSTIYKAALEVYQSDLKAYNTQDSLNRQWVYEDSKEIRQKYVAQRILDEEALENCFEGTRFYDLMRYVRQEGDNSSTIKMPSYIETLYGKSSRNIDGKPWYLTLPTR